MDYMAGYINGVLQHAFIGGNPIDELRISNKQSIMLDEIMSGHKSVKVEHYSNDVLDKAFGRLSIKIK